MPAATLRDGCSRAMAALPRRRVTCSPIETASTAPPDGPPFSEPAHRASTCNQVLDMQRSLDSQPDSHPDHAHEAWTPRPSFHFPLPTFPPSPGTPRLARSMPSHTRTSHSPPGTSSGRPCARSLPKYAQPPFLALCVAPIIVLGRRTAPVRSPCRPPCWVSLGLGTNTHCTLHFVCRVPTAEVKCKMGDVVVWIRT